MDGITKRAGHCFPILSRMGTATTVIVIVGLVTLGVGLAARRSGLPLSQRQIGLAAVMASGFAGLTYLSGELVLACGRKPNKLAKTTGSFVKPSEIDANNCHFSICSSAYIGEIACGKNIGEEEIPDIETLLQQIKDDLSDDELWEAMKADHLDPKKTDDITKFWELTHERLEQQFTMANSNPGEYFLHVAQMNEDIQAHPPLKTTPDTSYLFSIGDSDDEEDL